MLPPSLSAGCTSYVAYTAQATTVRFRFNHHDHYTASTPIACLNQYILAVRRTMRNDTPKSFILQTNPYILHVASLRPSWAGINFYVNSHTIGVWFVERLWVLAWWKTTQTQPGSVTLYRQTRSVVVLLLLPKSRMKCFWSVVNNWNTNNDILHIVCYFHLVCCWIVFVSELRFADIASV